MRISIVIMTILVGYIASDLTPSPDVPGGGDVTQDWYRKYLERLELERLAQAKGEPKKTITC